ncbi:hypothetical protein CI105_06995 [Candidatus Izimaplasma bacterium ZiA1]|uniref:hypothetical protein n=1 Tax=Candidatus Izimoplasma sp. ZiA1 TaxID=2024899 RepID=UPI000BAA4A52|nr:hypothetical protein CI105_06995 [Candidatus Izimaplasma bacterium ZiA1]
MKNKKTVFIILLGFTVTYFLVSYFIDRSRYTFMMYHHNYSTISSPLYYINGFILFVGLTSLLIVVMLSFDKSNNKLGNFKAILDERLAAGEITIDEYNDIMNSINK